MISELAANIPELTPLPGVYNPLLKRMVSESESNVKSGRFLKGPIPILWLCEASKTTFSGYRMGIALWYQAGLHKNKRFKLQPARCREVCVDGSCYERGLNELEEAGLIRRERSSGATPVVEILAPEFCQ